MPTYGPGDKVLLSTENLNLKARGEAGVATKWKHRWVGPFEVLKQTGTTVELKLPYAWAELHRRFHVELLRPYHGAPGGYDEPPPELDSEGAEIYEVEKIINHRWNGRRKRFEWRVKWKGCPDADNPWEPLENLVGASDLLKQYRKTHGVETTTTPRQRAGKARTYGVTWMDEGGQFTEDQLEMVFEYENQGENGGCACTESHAGYTCTESRAGNSCTNHVCRTRDCYHVIRTHVFEA